VIEVTLEPRLNPKPDQPTTVVEKPPYAPGFAFAGLALSELSLPPSAQGIKGRPSDSQRARSVAEANPPFRATGDGVMVTCVAPLVLVQLSTVPVERYVIGADPAGIVGDANWQVAATDSSWW
jgi:hypothetical protein